MSRTLLVALAVALLPAPLPAQQNSMPDMPDMPGMHMDHSQPRTSPQKQPSPLQTPAGLRHPAANDPAAQAAAESLQQSAQQQRNQQPAGPGSDAPSLSRPTDTLQEPENPTFHTGLSPAASPLPAPDLLAGVSGRPALSLLQFQQWAAASNPTLAEARSLITRSEQQARQAGLPPNPSLGYSGEHIRGGQYGGGEEGAFLQQTLVLGHKLALRRDLYRQQAASDTIGLDEQQARVGNDLEQAFYNALTSQRIVTVRQNLLQIALDASTTAHQLANLGQADAPDILQAEVEAEQARVDLATAQRLFLQDFSILAALAGQPSLAAVPLAGDLEATPPLDAEARVREIVAESPSTRRAQADLAVAQARLRSARRESVPDLALQAGEWYSGETLDGIHHPAGWMSFAQASLTLPLWNRNQGNVEAAAAELARSRQDLVRTQLMLQQQAEPTAQQLLAARFTADRYRTQLLPRARRAYQLYLLKYQSMAAAYPQVLVSQRTLFQLQISYLEALRSVWLNTIALQHFTLSGGLSQPLSAGSPSTSLNLPNRSSD